MSCCILWYRAASCLYTHVSDICVKWGMKNWVLMLIWWRRLMKAEACLDRIFGKWAERDMPSQPRNLAPVHRPIPLWCFNDFALEREAIRESIENEWHEAARSSFPLPLTATGDGWGRKEEFTRSTCPVFCLDPHEMNAFAGKRGAWNCHGCQEKRSIL